MMKLPNGYGSVSHMGGNRRRPWGARITIGYEIDPKTEKLKTHYKYIGYARTKTEALQLLAEYNKMPFDIEAARMTFKEVYNLWSEEKFASISQSSIKSYQSSYNVCEPLYNMVFKDLKTAHLQKLIDNCGKHYPMLKKVRLLFSQMYEYAMKNDICNKDYSEFVDLAKHQDDNPNAREGKRIDKETVERLWTVADDKYYQIILMLIYSGPRIGELCELLKEDVHLDEKYYVVKESKTVSGIRKVPIADKVYPFFENWYNMAPDCKYLIHTDKGKKFEHWNYINTYFKPLLKNIGAKEEYTPHHTRHTCISMLKDAKVEETTIKKIVGHKGAMSLTEKVYTHLDMSVLHEAINKI